MRSPRVTRRSTSRTTARPSYALRTPRASITRLPATPPASSSNAAAPGRDVCAARSDRIADSARRRPWLRLRRAEIPSTAQRASAAIFRFSLWRAASSCAKTSSRQSSNRANPASWRRTAPRSIHSVARVVARRNARSCEMRTKAVRDCVSSASSQPIASMSRWFVGSSSSSRPGDCASTRASAARLRSPPDARPGSTSRRRRSPSAAASTRQASAGSRTEQA